ncbi:MAG: hypothetical protein K8R75_03820 [Deltaproteobacteria bacterium]|nr:hypothetical protein [Deltaproteobacteria bacterium]
MATNGKAEFEPNPVVLEISQDDLHRLERLKAEAEEEFNLEIYGSKSRPLDKAYHHPDGRPDVSYAEIGEMKRQRLGHLSELISNARQPQSRLMIPRNAWAWDLRDLQGTMDEFAKKLLDNYDLYLCRHIMSLVEQEKEKIKWVSVELSSSDCVIYRIWPTETYKAKGSLSVEAKLSAQIGLTQALEIVELPLSGDASLVWQGKWEWVSVIIKAWGVGGASAGWELTRDASAPFSGDREFYLMLQVPRRKMLKTALARLRAKIKPSMWETSFVYEPNGGRPLEIEYHTP